MLDIIIIAGNQFKQYFKDAENKSSINKNNWDQHQRRLNIFVGSKYIVIFFYLYLKGRFYYIIYREKKSLILMKCLLLNLLAVI